MAKKRKAKMIEINEIHVSALGLIVILVLTAIALAKGLDGVMFGSSMAGIGAVIGWVFKNHTPKK